ncbi:BTAD domain-containing putative transcriptional regulator [Amycolatopsis rhabdoformis]|uniref:BTAD domain-containing putative transcriptional regulator n=1 Tax=Amycolatopsis rhabdoformis TaxID=1448059 RepID=A0ABZ1IPH9_9PSEU|nr:BTAD domain-containing putative transcriptional regulator [Amycolatopsis rhabdoformis]WSE35269.1 BTAD domain-containing putative transcriptional regulator [Amycolatopsis rhabdoformis]
MVACRHGHEVSLGPPRHRAVLGLLVLRPGRIVPTEQLIDELWGEQAPRNPISTLQTYVSHLRRRLLAVGEVGEAERAVTIRHQSNGYVTDIDPALVDTHQFERLTRHGRTRATAGELAQSCADLEAALELWRGDPFAEFTSIERFAEESARLEQLRIAAVETSAENSLELGRLDSVVALLTPETARHPSRERMVGHLMTALYRTGRQADALMVFERTRAYLSDELGVDPSAELRRIHTAIIRQEIPVDVRVPAQRQDGPAAPIELLGTPRSSELSPTMERDERLFGRASELAALTEAVEDSTRRGGHIVAVVGEAGIGKTELVLRLLGTLDTTAQDIVRATCWRAEGTPGYWSWAQVFRELTRLRPEAVAAARERFGSLLDPVCLEWPVSAGEPERSDTERFMVHDAICCTLLDLADERPILLVVEDLQWADQASVDLLDTLSRRSNGHRLGVVVTVCTTRIGHHGPPTDFTGDLLDNARTRTLELRGLPNPVIASMAGEHVGRPVRPEMVKVLRERSGGNPSMLKQLMPLLPEHGDSDTAEAVEAVRAGIPGSLRAAIARGLGTMPAAMQQALRACAVLGPEIDVLVFAEIVDDVNRNATLDALVATGLLHRDALRPGLVRFVLEIVREAIDQGMDDDDRNELHQRIARTMLARLDHSAPRVLQTAHHLWHAAPVMPADSVVPHLLRAGQDAAKRFSYREAELWFRRGLELLARDPAGSPSPDLSRTLSEGLADSLVATRGWSDAEAGDLHRRILAAPKSADDREHEILIRWKMCCSNIESARYDECARLAEEIREIAGSREDPFAAGALGFLAGVGLHIRGRFEPALAEFESAIALIDGMSHSERLRRSGQQDIRVPLRSYRALTLWLMGRTEEARRACDELLVLTETDCPPMDRAFALYAHSLTAALDDDVAEAARTSSEGLDLAARFGLRALAALLQVIRGWTQVEPGRSPDDGIILMRQGIRELSRINTLVQSPLRLALLAQSLRAVGRAAEADEVERRRAAEVRLRGEIAYGGPVTARRRPEIARHSDVLTESEASNR